MPRLRLPERGSQRLTRGYIHGTCLVCHLRPMARAIWVILATLLASPCGQAAIGPMFQPRPQPMPQDDGVSQTHVTEVIIIGKLSSARAQELTQRGSPHRQLHRRLDFAIRS